MLTFIGAVGVTLMLGTIVWMLLRSQDRQRRLNARLDELQTRLVQPREAAATLVQPVESPVRAVHDKVLDQLKGSRAPGFRLPDLAGHHVSLDQLREPGRPLVLIFTEPRCGPCYELLPDIAGWQQRYGEQLSIALISSGEVNVNRHLAEEYGIENVLVQQDLEVVLAYHLAQAPAAVLIDAEGTVSAGPRYGANAVRSLLAEALGLGMPALPRHDGSVIRRGSLAPTIQLPDLQGRIVDLRGWRGRPIMLLFWNPGCSFCASLLADALAFERLAQRSDLIVISRGPYALNVELGFASPVVLDESRVVGQSLGVTGTPAAVLIDAEGRVATDVARGTDDVRHLLGSVAIAMRSPVAAPTPANVQAIA